MSDETWPMPISPYGMRRHLSGEHNLNLWGMGWTEMVELHDHAHQGAEVDHVHEKGG